MEENKEIMVNEDEEIEALEPIEDEETGNSGSGVVVAGLLALGAAMGIGAYKGVKYLKSKATDWKEKRSAAKKAKEEIIDADIIDPQDVYDEPDEK